MNYKCLASQSLYIFMKMKLRSNCYPVTCKSFKNCLDLLKENPGWEENMVLMDCWGMIGSKWSDLKFLYNEMVFRYDYNPDIDYDKTYIGKKFCDVLIHYGSQECPKIIEKYEPSYYLEPEDLYEEDDDDELNIFDLS